MGTMEIRIGDYMIRDLQESDASSIAKYANNRKIWINLRDVFPHPYHRTDAKEFLAQVLQNEPRVVFGIATEDEAIGTIGLILGTDVHRFTAELGYWLAEPYATNPASARVLEKAGFNREGILRSSVFKDGRVLDQWLYAKIREEIG
jgi:RimJ/RimL family protein N-acetyltransferase